MSKPLPIGEFGWINSDNELFTNKQALLDLSESSEIGYIFEVDLQYPKQLHDAHNDYPFCAERRQLPKRSF